MNVRLISGLARWYRHEKVPDQLAHIAAYILARRVRGDFDRISEFPEHLARRRRQRIARILRYVALSVIFMRDEGEQRGERGKQHDEKTVLDEQLEAKFARCLHCLSPSDAPRRAGGSPVSETPQ